MTLSPVKTHLSARERYAGLLQGAFLGDSLALGAHWLYDQREIVRLFDRVTDLQAPLPESYHPGKEAGDLTHYGDQALVLMESLNACGGNFVMDDFAKRWRKFWETSKSYRDKATKQTLIHLQEGHGFTTSGSDIADLGGTVRIAPLLAALREEDQSTIVAAARAQTAFTHAAPLALDTTEFIARTVFLIMRGVTVVSALHMAAALPYKKLPAEAWLKSAQELQALPTGEAVEELGQACPIEQALPSIFAILLRHGDSFEDALIENVMAGGDSAARGAILGMLLGAAHGQRAIPERWALALQAQPQIDAFTQTVGL